MCGARSAHLFKRKGGQLMKTPHYIKYFIVLAVFILAFATLPIASNAKTVGYSGGVQNENKYKEVVFITGKPIVFEGTNKTVTVTEKVSGTKITETYKMTLTGPNSEKLTRNFTYVSELKTHEDKTQTTSVGEVTKYTEKIVIGSTTYTLEDYQLSQSRLNVTQPATSYLEGNAIMRKTYKSSASRGQTAKEIIVTATSKNEGYENFWGATNSQVIEYEYNFGDNKIWTVRNVVSSSKSRTINYDSSNATLSFIDGGYSVISNADMVSSYIYEMPEENGVVDLNLEYMPRIERLVVPKFRDISKNWAREDIGKLYSLGIFDDNSNFFSPNSFITRYDFTIAIGKAIDLRVLEENVKKTTPSIFKDVTRTAKDYQYLVSAYEKGVIKGVNATTFSPDGYLTRQQAAAILIRALGLEGKAPDPGFKTPYADDTKIFDYARDSVYMVYQLGLITGIPSGNSVNFNPTGHLTRAQASVIISRFLTYLEEDLKTAYRDDIQF